MDKATDLEAWALPQLRELLPLDDSELKQIITYTLTLDKGASIVYLNDLLGDSPKATHFAESLQDCKVSVTAELKGTIMNNKRYHDEEVASNSINGKNSKLTSDAPPAYAPPPGPPPSASGHVRAELSPHTNAVIEAAKLRARDEQDMQQTLQTLQYKYGIYNSDIEPEHETEYYCNCGIHNYQRLKWHRYPVQKQWCKAVMYPGEKYYNDAQGNGAVTGFSGMAIFSSNPYQMRVVSPYGYGNANMFRMVSKPVPSYYARNVHQTIDLNNSLNRKALASVEAVEPKHSIWDDDEQNTMALTKTMVNMQVDDQKRKRSVATGDVPQRPENSKRFSSFRKSLGIKTTEEKASAKAEKAIGYGNELRAAIEAEERGRWPEEQTRWLAESYQQHMGMFNKIADLRARSPIQYLHLLRAGYFEPIPIAWANSNSNPLKFSIEAAAGWRGITPAWRGYEDTAEERLYWVLNHREGSDGAPSGRMKPDQISEMNMARERMAKAVEPPPDYFDATDQCHIQHTSAGYSKQVMPTPFRAYDRPETATDDTMILLDVSGSMDFDPLRPVYDQYLVTGWEKSTQPKNKDVAKAIIRRFTDAMENHDRQFRGYDLVTFANSAQYIGTINHQNFDGMWQNVRLGGGTRVMTGWQRCKDLHFQKHSESATHHPVFGWQAGPDTPMLRLLLLLDGEATDMDEFELDLLGLSWAHVTIFLIGVDGCPHHHRHANELQRISDVNHHVSFVDAQGNCPERFVTHELLKRHLGYEISMQEFREMEELPAYSETA